MDTKFQIHSEAVSILDLFAKVKVRHTLFFISSLLVSGCATDAGQPSLLGGWERKSVQVDERQVFPKSSQKYFFKDEGLVVVSSTGEHTGLSYVTRYGMAKLSDRWLVIIEYPLREISVHDDTVTTFDIYELKEIDSQRLVWRFITNGPCKDSLRIPPCKVYRTEYFERQDWDTSGLQDTIPVTDHF